MLRRLHDSDRGASVLEYAAIIVLVAAVAAALFAVDLPRIIGEGIESAAERALNGEGEQRPDDGPRPEAEPDGSVPGAGTDTANPGDAGTEGSGAGGGGSSSADPGVFTDSGGPTDSTEPGLPTGPGRSDTGQGPGTDVPGFLDTSFLRGGSEHYLADPSTTGEETSGQEGDSAIAPEDDTTSEAAQGSDSDQGDDDRPAFTWQDKGNYDWDCGWVAHYLCVVGGGLSQGVVEMGEGILDLGCHLHLCSHESFKETWSGTSNMAKGLWNDPLGSVRDMWDAFTEPFTENHENLGGGDGLVKNLGYGATMLVGGFLKPLKVLGNGKTLEGGGSNRSSNSNDSGDSGNQVDGDGRRDRDGGVDCDNSFLPGTLVLLADGDARPIEQIAVGDSVLATDPLTGEQGARQVSALISGEGERTLVEVWVDDGTDVADAVTTTHDHPFWVPGQGWTEAGDLAPGTWLRTGNGTWVRVSAVETHTVLDQVVHNLTVEDLRTYHVLAGDAPLLVHNCPPGGGDRGPTATERRNSPGTATGGQNLPDITGTWLRGSHGNAGRTPGQVARRLEGRSFENFGEFRSAYWRAVADTPELAGQFAPHQVTRMRNGNAPIAAQNQQVGGNRSYVLHHTTPIGRGGGVYDLDNIMVVTPRYHREILDPDYHYGGD